LAEELTLQGGRQQVGGAGRRFLD